MFRSPETIQSRADQHSFHGRPAQLKKFSRFAASRDFDYVKRCSSRAPLGAGSLCHPGFHDVPDQTLRSFNEGELVRKAGFKQYANAIVAAHVGCRDESDVLSNAKVNQVEGLGQDEKALGCRGLYLSEFLAEVLNKNIVKASTELHWLLTDKLEALVQPGKELV